MFANLEKARKVPRQSWLTPQTTPPPSTPKQSTQIEGESLVSLGQERGSPGKMNRVHDMRSRYIW